jgi:predicted anti-sigma-YlaC factor YlaD
MIDIALDFFARKWLETGSFFVTCAALFYAHLAYRTSERGLDHAKSAELNSLRLQAKAGLNDARQTQVSLELSCQVYRANWASYARTQPSLNSVPAGIFDRSPVDRVQFKGRQLLQPAFPK